ncbi:MAG: SGNH/GDSL hydrolase family protein [Candidatus Rokuibacteriota bacterium]
MTESTRSGSDRLRRFVLPAVLLVASVWLTLVVAEIVVRVHLWRRPISFHVVNTAYGQYDARFGQRFRPNSRKVLSLVNDGKVVWCPGVVASANDDGLGGRSTLRDARNADYVIFTTGDSFSYWTRSGVTVPDIVESLLAQRTGLKVVNLNFARGAYGLLQMLTLAADIYPILKPDLVVVQLISDDLTRGRWWTREAVIDGRTRSQISPRPDGFDDPRITNDQDVVDGRATEEWCQRQLGAPDPDHVVRDSVAYHRAYLRSKGITFDPLSVTKSYFIDAVWSTVFGKPLYSQTAFSLMPRVTAREFLADPGYHDAVQKLKTFGAPLVLVHLPNKAEVITGRPFRGRDAEAIWLQLEKDLGTRIVTLAATGNHPAPPPTIDLQPNNAHPNLDGIRFYGEYVAAIIEPRVKRR